MSECPHNRDPLTCAACEMERQAKEREDERWWQAFCAVLGRTYWAGPADPQTIWAPMAAQLADDAIAEAKKRGRLP